MIAEFVECAACKAKPGSPRLCDSCLANREAISRLNKRVEELEGVFRLINGVLEAFGKRVS